MCVCVSEGGRVGEIEKDRETKREEEGEEEEVMPVVSFN